MKKITRFLILGIVFVLFAFGYYYITLPAINIHSSGFWIFIISVLLIACFISFLSSLKGKVKVENHDGTININSSSRTPSHKFSILTRLLVVAIIVVVLIFMIGSLLSSPIVNAGKYQKLLTVENRDFTTDIEEVNFDQIPLLDRESSQLLGNRKMGSIVDMVSQFEVSDLYSQINYNGKPVRVSPLIYASPIKWLTNQSSGIPAYILIDMATQNTECVRLEKPIKYSQSELFNRNIIRHLRFKYPTYIVRCV